MQYLRRHWSEMYMGLFNSGKLVTLIDMSDLKDKHQELSDIYNHYMEEGGERHE